MTSRAEKDGPPSVSERVIRAIAEELGKDPTELDPLYHSISPECLNELFPALLADADDPVRQLTFAYEEHVVRISHDGSVEIISDDGTNPDGSLLSSRDASTQEDP